MTSQLNYYQILGINSLASKQQICQAYKNLALQYHPSLKHQNQNKAYKTFCLVSEAFDILYDDQKRTVYDKHGEQQLKQNIVNENGQKIFGQYTFTTEPEIIFEKFFGSKNVYEHLLSVGSGQGRSHQIFSSQYGNVANIQSKTVAPLIVPVNCTLSELFNGCKKTLTYKKNVLSKDGQDCIEVAQTKTIDIPVGACSSNPICFEGQGNQMPGESSSNLVFEIIEIPEMGFIRSKSNSDNLIYTANISLMDALDAKSIEVKQLSGEIIQLHFDQIISPQTERTVEGKGMPRDGIQGRGDLIVNFNIIFPQEIEIQKKQRIIQLLKKQI